MGIQTAVATVGVAKQTAKGAAAANPTFLFGISDGPTIKTDTKQERSKLTSGTRAAPGVDRTSFEPGMDYKQRAHVASLPLLLYAALGGKATTGAGPYTHVLTPAAVLPYLTFFGTLDGLNTSVADCRIDELTLSFDGPGPVEVAVAANGTTIGFPATITPTTDETRAPYFAAAGGTFKLDVASGTPVAAAVKSGELKLKNSVDPIQLASSISPNDVMPGALEIDVSMTVVPEDFGLWRTITTGSAGGTTIRESVLYGSMEWDFTNGTNTFVLACPRVAFVTEVPDSDAGGGAAEADLSGIVVLPLSGAQITATCVNTTASY